MEDYLINLGLNVLFTALGTTIKNPASKAKYKAAILKLYRAIKTAFAGDPDFQ